MCDLSAESILKTKTCTVVNDYTNKCYANKTKILGRRTPNKKLL